jgi:glucose/mannose transport system substrate-binding protein
MKQLNRREFLKLGAILAGGAALAACAPAAAPAPAAPAATAAPAAAAPKATDAPKAAAPAAGAAKQKLEIFSWWTSGGEVEALNALLDPFAKKYPNVEVVNSAIAGGSSSGGDMKAVLQTRMMGGDPPESFQIHLGGELLDGSYVSAGKMEPLDFLYKEEGWDKVFPKSLIDIASKDGKPYSVPVNIHRANVLWYNTKMLKDIGAEAPKTWDEFFVVAEKLKAKGIPALAIAENAPGFAAQVFETVLIENMGPEKFQGLFNGKTSWEDPAFKKSLDTFKKILSYANPDYTSVSWGDVNDLMVNGKVAMMVMGDWTPGVFWSKGFKDFGWRAAPGNDGIVQMLSDSFGLPKNVKNREAAVNFLRMVGSKDGQDAFNPPKGSIPARTDADPSKYSEYQKWAMDEWKKDKIIPSIVHGSAAGLAFMTDYMNAINVFATKKDTDQTAAAILKAAKDAGLQK